MVYKPHITSQNKAKCKVDQSGDPTGKILYSEINNHLKVAIQQAKSLESQSWRVLLKFGVMLRLRMFGCTRAINLSI